MSADQLVLFDFLWPCDLWAPLRLLSQSAFPYLANIPNSHAIPDDQLVAWLDEMVFRHLFESCEKPSNAPVEMERCFRLTRRGGEAWESERRPRWERYVNVDAFPSNESDYRILCLDQALGRHYIEVGVDAGLIAAPKSLRHRVLKDANLTPWRRFSAVHEFSYKLAPDEADSPDWESYERGRSWWSSSKELLKSASWAQR